MMRKEHVWRAGMIMAVAAGLASAHLSTDGLKPAAGETVNIGASYMVTWKELNHHGKGTDIDLSLDGGKSWNTVVKNFSDVQGMNTFNWKVEGTATTKAKIRICQHEGTPVTGCRDSDTANALTADIGGNYIMITSMFSLAAATGIRSVASAPDFSFGFRPEAGNLDVTFGLAESAPVLLQAFDSQGRLQATLLRGEFASGRHGLSVPTQGLADSDRPILLEFRSGGRVQSRVWAAR